MEDFPSLLQFHLLMEVGEGEGNLNSSRKEED